MKLRRYFSILFFTLAFAVIWCSMSMAQAVLQTQYGPDGMEVDLMRAKISGKVLSVVFSFRNVGTSAASVKYKIADVNYIDNTESKKYHVLKDEKEEYLSGPIEFVIDLSNSEKLAVTSAYLPNGKQKIVWYKFPAPQENVSKIQINLPDISPFDDVEIAR